MSTSSRRITIRLAVALALAVPVATRGIVLEDPTNFQVKQTYSAESLGVPGPLGGLLFSIDGGVLYVVGASETSAGALYAVPVTRDAMTNEVTSLGPATAVTKAFDGNSATPGLDAGIEFGPAGTLFYTYWSANYLGERPGGIGGAEMQFDMARVGVLSSIAGLTFSPHRIDPSTGFGRMQISSWPGANLFEVPLSPPEGGIFTPGSVTPFVTLPQQGTGAIEYVPSGPLAGNLMYVNYTYGEVRLLTIDGASGLPIDRETGQPTLGTTNPVDTRFASDLGVGPWGLEFDPLTNDFFVATFHGNPDNAIIQIGGSGFPPPVTTTTTPTTTTTTQPPDRCAGKDCNDGNPCTEDRCDPADGSCSNLPARDGASCDDGDPCTDASTCQAGTCTGGQTLCAVDLPAEGAATRSIKVPMQAVPGSRCEGALFELVPVAQNASVPPGFQVGRRLSNLARKRVKRRGRNAGRVVIKLKPNRVAVKLVQSAPTGRLPVLGRFTITEPGGLQRAIEKVVTLRRGNAPLR